MATFRSRDLTGSLLAAFSEALRTFLEATVVQTPSRALRRIYNLLLTYTTRGGGPHTKTDLFSLFISQTPGAAPGRAAFGPGAGVVCVLRLP